MKKIVLIGTGPGSTGFLVDEARKIIETADLLIGAKTVIDRFANISNSSRTLELIDVKKIAEELHRCDEELAAVLFSGDTGFYSGCKGLLPLIEDLQPVVYPGISSMSMLSARCGITWEDALIVSLHGRDDNLVHAVSLHRKVFVLCSPNMKEWLGRLVHAGLGNCEMIIGEELSLPDERILRGTVASFYRDGIKPLSVCFIMNEHPAYFPYPGIPDDLFARGNTPMTKREIRALAISRLSIVDGEVIYDVGAGTGSVTVELAIGSLHGVVYAIERSPEAINLIRKNEEIFGLHNIHIINGEAPEAFDGLPIPDVAFVGGSGGNMESIVRSLVRMNEKVRIAMTAITIETATAGIAVLEELKMQPEMIQVAVSSTKKAGNGHMIIAQNPVWLITGRR
ncbi:MAG: precorrin-6y C5,15-methyltransferase (decarboxylating) subunit CbiE [Lachnospiraceae bacterium]|nr:precorrin-6y C5,15-methyltransferase (decarboxylating) subunit CbiE [Lachnospiraceae bacterium]